MEMGKQKMNVGWDREALYIDCQKKNSNHGLRHNLPSLLAFFFPILFFFFNYGMTVLWNPMRQGQYWSERRQSGPGQDTRLSGNSTIPTKE